jgi:hypothetical protein
MAENKLKTDPPKAAPPKPTGKKKGGALFGSLNFNLLFLFDNIYYIFYVGFLGIIYIANSHYAMQTIKEIKKIQTELQKTSWESNFVKSELMLESMESRVSVKVQHLGLQPLKDSPKKIITKEP